MIRLLFADDNMLALNQLDLYAALHEDEMLVVGRARNGQAALDLMQRQRPDVAFIDADMPVMNGVEVARAAAERGLPVRLIGLSNFDSYEYVRGMMKAGAVDYLLKHELDESAFVGKVREAYASAMPGRPADAEPDAPSGAAAQRLLAGFLAGDADGDWISRAFGPSGAGSCALVLTELSLQRPEASADAARYAQPALSVVSNLCETVGRGAVCRLDDLRLATLLFPAEGAPWADADAAARDFVRLIEGNLMRLMRLRALSKYAVATDCASLRGALARLSDAPCDADGRAVGADEARYGDHVRLSLREIREKYSSPISLERTAKRCYVSPVYLSRLFRAEVGITFIDYLTQYRVNRAKSLLAQTNRSVKEISVLTGFRDDSYFIKVFKQRDGRTPAEYRAQCPRRAPDPENEPR